MPTATQTASPQVHGGQPSSPDHCILLSGVRWETYESLLADMQDSHAAHFAYDRGLLESMAPSYEHDNLKHIFAVLVEFPHFAAKTWQVASSLMNGYIQHAERVRGKKQIDLAQDSRPTLLSKSTSPARR